MKRHKLFCEISPLTYSISVARCCIIRWLTDMMSHKKFAKEKRGTHLPVLIYSHNSLMRRKLGNSEPELQENKVVNLTLSAPRVSGIVIKPGEEFSFWKLVGPCSRRRGYMEGLVISSGKTDKGTGGGMCQFTNLIHWLVLHTPLEITEHHHHDGVDLFPDYGRQVPFGTGTSVFFNYLDYRFKNNTQYEYQIIVYTTKKYLHGEIRSQRPQELKYHISSEDECFVREDDGIYRTGIVKRRSIDKKTGNTVSEEVIKENHAKVMYDTSGLQVVTKEKSGSVQ
ncbi:MAG: VanW family protein [Oscillospiraceae bacterium]|nr:VanW family protein [Oscillospiraceae bacterium]